MVPLCVNTEQTYIYPGFVCSATPAQCDMLLIHGGKQYADVCIHINMRR